MISVNAGGQIFGIPAHRMARITGAIYAVNILASPFAIVGPKTFLDLCCGLVSTAAYIVITILFYFLFKPVSRSVSFVAALFSMTGCIVGNWVVHVPPIPGVHFMVYFGFYCVLIGYLIIRSSFMPRFVGVLMMCAGAGYLTFLWQPFGNSLSPYNVIPGACAEITLTIWLLVKGVDQERWTEQSGAIAASATSFVARQTSMKGNLQ